MSHATLCILSYERPQFLRVAIETAIAGCDEPVEVIVHDDGSADPELLKYLYTIHQQGTVSSVLLNAPGVNRGQGVALNRMFRMATGDPILKLDQDLVFKPGWLAKVKEILRDDRVGLCALFKYWNDPVDWRQTIIPDSQLASGRVEEPDGGLAHKPPMPLYALPRGYTFHTHIIGSGFAVPRRVWEKLGPFPERWESFGEDWEFQKRVHSSAELFNALPDEDLVDNVGFGVGPSTVVVQGESGPEPSRIHQLPMLVGGN